MTTQRNSNDGHQSRFPSTVLSLFSLTTAADSKSGEPDDEQSNNEVQSPKPITTRRRSAPAETSLSETSSMSIGRRRPAIFDRYKPVKKIGQGRCGTVFAVETRMGGEGPAVAADGKQTPPKGLYACKIIDLATSKSASCVDTTVGKELLEDVLREIDAMKGNKHPNVQDLVDYAVEADKVYIVSSLCRGGDLAQALELRGCLCEEDAKTVMAGILRGMSHLHSRGVVHRDIKLENILLAKSSHDMSKVKIIDLGFAKKLCSPGATPEEAFNSVCGTPLYFAPELVRPSLRAGKLQDKARYGTQADMWACGVILYRILSGFPPFEPTETADVFRLFEDIDNVVLDFSDPVWELVSDEALQLIEGLLEADPSKRLTAEEALQHPWMVSY